jgi:hypothetical protein
MRQRQVPLVQMRQQQEQLLEQELEQELVLLFYRKRQERQQP